ncbi:MAG: 30S ribosomal protein S9 [Deltaproteobacteria bacterium]|nr:30S ribosomal protein S9 [Deltaproteobacteria bacterium]MCL6120446.1 30S ribosomal protein S9 [Deltaproteobacteria bacterium]
MAKKSIIHAVGKRKTGIARAYFKEGAGKIIINGRDFEQYFPLESHRVSAVKPLAFYPIENKFDIYINVSGGGLSGQAGAVRLALAKAILLVSPELKETLAKASMLTRDPRVKERKKYGQKAARARFQFSKR